MSHTTAAIRPQSERKAVWLVEENPNPPENDGETKPAPAIGNIYFRTGAGYYSGQYQIITVGNQHWEIQFTILMHLCHIVFYNCNFAQADTDIALSPHSFGVPFLYA